MWQITSLRGWTTEILMNQTSLATHLTQGGNKTAHLHLFLESLAIELFILVGGGPLPSYLFLLVGSYENYSNPMGVRGWGQRVDLWKGIELCILIEFHEENCEQCFKEIWPSDLVFYPTWPLFKPDQYIIKSNILAEFYEAKTVASRVHTKF